MAVVERTRKSPGGGWGGATDRRTARNGPTGGDMKHTEETEEREDTPTDVENLGCRRACTRRECGTFLNSTLVLFNAPNVAHDAFHTRLCVT